MSDVPVQVVGCPNACDIAYLEAQRQGKTPALCDTTSEFMIDYADCKQCAQFSGGANSHHDPYKAFLAEYIDYCNDLSASTVITPLPAAQTLEPIGGPLVIGIASSTSVTTITTSSPTSPAFSQPPPTNTPTNTKTKSKDNTAIIVSPVLGTTIFLLLALLIWTYLRRHRRRAQVQPLSTQNEHSRSLQEEMWHKPELPGSLLQRLKRWQPGRLRTVHELDAMTRPSELDADGKTEKECNTVIVPAAAELNGDEDGNKVEDGTRQSGSRYELEGDAVKVAVDGSKSVTDIEKS